MRGGSRVGTSISVALAAMLSTLASLAVFAAFAPAAAERAVALAANAVSPTEPASGVPQDHPAAAKYASTGRPTHPATIDPLPQVAPSRTMVADPSRPNLPAGVPQVGSDRAVPRFGRRVPPVHVGTIATRAGVYHAFVTRPENVVRMLSVGDTAFGWHLYEVDSTSFSFEKENHYYEVTRR
ncbi:MAG: hypothetical protein ACLFNT_06810 [Spirochaetales bacterium]